jgi:O-antigen/teichoic acid export membrane protein
MNERPLTTTSVHGVTWIGISQAIGQGLRFASMIVLARLLFPEDFGIIAMVSLVTDLALQSVDMGFNEALIQRKEITESHLSTTFWTGLVIGIILCLIIVAISPFVASFFNNALVGPALAVSALSLVIGPLRTVHGSLLRKRLQFQRFAFGEIGQVITYITIAISLAAVGFGIWSLVIANVASQLALVVLRYVVCRWHPSFTFSFESLKDLGRFGLSLTGSRVIQFFIQRLDYIIIGRFLTPAALGFYFQGYRVTNFPVTTLEMGVGRVAYSTFSIIQDEHERLRRGFIRSLTYISMIAFPLFSGLAIVAPEFVKVVFGENWIPTTVPLQILCVMATVTTLGVTVVRPVIRSKGRPDIELKLNILKLFLLVPALLVGVRFGTIGVAIGISAVALVTWIPLQLITNRIISVRARDYLSALYPATIGSTIMAVILLAFRYTMLAYFVPPDIILLLSSVILGFGAYLAVLKIGCFEALPEVIELIRIAIKPFLKLATGKQRLA